MSSGNGSPNYYQLLEIEPDADIKTVHRVYRLLALRYHPDNPETGDTERFLLLSEAYRILTDPSLRADYNSQVESLVRHEPELAPAPLPVFLSREFTEGMEAESKMRLGVLALLYLKRKSNPDVSAVSLLDLENMMAIPREHLRFTLWFLKAKRFVLQDERSSFFITAEGVEFTETQIPHDNVIQKIMHSQASTSLMTLKTGGIAQRAKV